MWQLVQTPVDFAHIPSGTHTLILSLSFPQCYFNNAPPTLPLDTTCIDCVPRKGLVFYITSDILLDPPVAPVSVSEHWLILAQLPSSPLEGCWRYSVSTALFTQTPVPSH